MEETKLNTFLQKTIPENLDNFKVTKEKINELLGWGTNNYINNDKELVFAKTTQLAESAFKNVIFLINSTSNSVLNMFEEQNNELDKLIVDVNSISTSLHKIRTIGGMQELDRLTSSRQTYRCKKSRTIKVADDEEEKSLKSGLVTKQSFVVHNTKKVEKDITEEIPNFDFDLSIPVFEKKRR